MRAIHESGAARTAFTVKASSPAREARIAALMGAEIDEEPMEAGDLGHAGHGPLEEELYCAAGWESEICRPEPCPELPLQPLQAA